MSLLMDALRKAEEAKRAAQAGGVTPQAPNAIEIPAPPPPQAASHDMELALEPLAPEPVLAASAGPAAASPAPLPPGHEQVQRNTIQNAFAAKKTARSLGDRAYVIALCGVAGLALLGIGGYVWWEMQPRNSLAIATDTPITSTPVRPPPQAAAPQPAAEAEAGPTLAVESVVKEKIAAFENRYLTPTAPASPSPVRITQSKPRVNPLLEQGYTALQQGNLAQAQQAYDQMLVAEPKNIDALYGLAAIAVHKQKNAQAEAYYLRILEADPRDALAHAGLAGLGSKAGSNAESRIKTLIAEQPDVPQLHFALGNLYAQAQRWRDAQQSYFLAYKNDGENPDAAFNLAVSLDQLHQDKLAAQYYAEALRLAAERPSAFNREQVQSRLRDLQDAQGRGR